MNRVSGRLSFLAIATIACSLLAPASTAQGCGVGLSGANVRIWIEGSDATEACSTITAMIREAGGQPVNWGGLLSESAFDYSPVCSDSLGRLGYEVVDTGGQMYGTAWCQWMVQRFGSSGTVTAPDLFGIVASSQHALQLQQESQNANSQATESALAQAYLTACSQHNGYIDNEYCVVDYPGWPAQPVPINSDGTWDSVQADINREDCQVASQDAAAAAQDGYPWSILPQYHADTGVCSLGSP